MGFLPKLFSVLSNNQITINSDYAIHQFNVYYYLRKKNLLSTTYKQDLMKYCLAGCDPERNYEIKPIILMILNNVSLAEELTLYKFDLYRAELEGTNQYHRLRDIDANDTTNVLSLLDQVKIIYGMFYFKPDLANSAILLKLMNPHDIVRLALLLNDSININVDSIARIIYRERCVEWVEYLIDLYGITLSEPELNKYHKLLSEKEIDMI